METVIARIYKITNTLNSKVYIGYTHCKYTSQRFNRHKFNARTKSTRYSSKLYNAIRKYGEDKFKIEEIYSSKNLAYTLKVMEPYFIMYFDTYNTGYNSTLGGEGRINAKHTKKTIDKIKKSLIGNKYRLGIPHTAEARARMSQSHLNRNKKVV